MSFRGFSTCRKPLQEYYFIRFNLFLKKKILNLKNDVRPGINSFSLIKSDFYRVTHKG